MNWAQLSQAERENAYTETAVSPSADEVPGWVQGIVGAPADLMWDAVQTREDDERAIRNRTDAEQVLAKRSDALDAKGMEDRRRKKRLDEEFARELADADGVLSVADRLVTLDQIMNAPAPDPLIRDVLDGGSLTQLVAPRGGYKTAVALDMALCIATGRQWGPHATVRGKVLYLVGEGGGRAFGIRVEAWAAHHGYELGAFSAGYREWFQMLDGAAPFMSAAWGELVDHAAAYRPSLVIVDTLSRHYAGLVENDNDDAATAVAKAKQLQDRAGSAVLVLHHPSKTGDQTTARGAGAWEAADDTILTIRRDDPETELVMGDAKQKNRETVAERWRLRVVEVPVRPNGTWQSSFVVEHMDPHDVAVGDETGAMRDEILTYLGQCAETDTRPNTTAFEQEFPGRRTVARKALRSLLADGQVRHVKGPRGSKLLDLALSPDAFAMGGAGDE